VALKRSQTKKKRKKNSKYSSLPLLYYRHSQVFLLGWTFLLEKVDDLLVVALHSLKLLNEPLRPSKSLPSSKKCPKNWILPLPGGALTNFPCKLRLFFSVMGVRVHPLHPLTTPMHCTSHPLQWRLLELSESRCWNFSRNWYAASPAQLLSHAHSLSWCSVSGLLCSVGTSSVSPALHRQPAASTMTLIALL